MEYSSLQKVIDSYAELSEADHALLQSKCIPKSFPRRSPILLEGDVCKGVYFVQSGLIGLYRVVNDQERYRQFYLPGSFATDVTSLTSQEAMDNNMIALEASELLFLSRGALLALYQESNNIQSFGRALLADLLVKQVGHSDALANLSARERYDYLLQKEPELVRQVPLQYLATYLGVSRETLSRIRKK